MASDLETGTKKESKLEKVLYNLGRGTVGGASAFVDPVGALISGVDYTYAGIGPADKARGNDTVYNEINKHVFSDYSENQDFAKSYIPRFAGTLLGSAAAYGTGALLWASSGPAAALFIPAVTGIYSLITGGIRYAKDWVNGEKIGDNYEKGSFYDGFKFGWHQNTNFLSTLVQPWESQLTMRGYDNSHFRGCSTTAAAKGARRNFRSMAGSFVGGIVGTAATVATLPLFGGIALYKTIRDSVKSVEGSAPAKVYYPKHVSSSPMAI